MKHSYVFLPCFHLLPHTNLIGAKTPALPKIAVVFFELCLWVLFISCISSALMIFQQHACCTNSYTQSEILILTIYIISKKKRVACMPAFLRLFSTSYHDTEAFNFIGTNSIHKYSCISSPVTKMTRAWYSRKYHPKV